MSAPQWKNTYELSEDQFQRLEEAEEKMELMEINIAENILTSLLEEDENCIPVLNIFGHMYGLSLIHI